MDNKVKIIIIALIAVLALSFFVSFQAYTSKQTIARERDSLKSSNESLVRKTNETLAQIQQLQNRMNAMNADLDRLTKEKTEIQDKLDLANKEKAGLAEQVKILKARQMDSADIQAIKNENAFLKRQLKALNNRRLELEGKLANIQDKNNMLNSQLSGMESMLKERISKTGGVSSSLMQGIPSPNTANTQTGKKEFVELPPIVVRPQKSSLSEADISGLAGKVLAVNRENNFIIIDVGEDDGVKTGHIFTVYRQNRPIAEVSVIQTRNDISACDIMKEETAIKVGDTLK
ncbi:MAG: hypothetical protein PHF11_03680 [Candidatus Omnitrophica bacterium]|nr:hypothetical protein [Candidatus Omnitrophota bacterium]